MPELHEHQVEINRVTLSRQQIQRNYDRRIGWYEFFIDPLLERCRELGVHVLNVQKDETVLEIGFGTGYALVPIGAKVGPKGLVYGIDNSRVMTTIAQQRVDQAGLSTRTFIQQWDAIRLPFENKFFSSIFISFTLELFDTPEIPLVLKECKRVLGYGGRICVVALAKCDHRLTRWYERLHQRYPRFLACRPIYTDQVLADAGFSVSSMMVSSVGGMPVDIVLAKTE